ncbi:unnamed protein product [Arctia plantaginis]|uniref:Multiple inositol polyphosphate phosphatase 1 n=1 Tax=Arctia plantaginis TaxID=874455 RepID=A0A8S1B1K0_ARCPL|nr:unnamed protein product [Arctia plantaginis]
MTVFVTTFLVALVYLSDIQVAAFIKSNDFGIENHLGSRTPYRFKYNKNDSPVIYENCRDHKIWMVIRHGTRLPGVKDIMKAQNLTKIKQEILLQHSNGKGQLSMKQLKQMEDWYNDIPLERDKFLTLEGQNEMIQLAERMQRRFPHAMKQSYDNKTILFRYTATQRAQQSARYFATGLFGEKDVRRIVFPPAHKIDKVLRFYKYCDKWQKQVKKNPETYKEYNLFGISREMNETLEYVSKRLGLTNVLTLEMVNTIYKLCGYETAWHKRHISVWCNAFDDKSIKVLEYYHDLRSYWLDGYANELTYRQGCVSMRHMFNSLTKENRPRATFLFTHSGTLVKILAHLGLYKPEAPLTGSKMVNDRQWRTSDIDSFAANLAFVLFKCKGGDRVLTLHQEKIVRLPMCSEDLCPLKKLTNYFQDSIHNCNFNEICGTVEGKDEATQVTKSKLNLTLRVNEEL